METKFNEEAFQENVLRIKNVIYTEISNEFLGKLGEDESISGAILMAMAELTGQLTARSGIHLICTIEAVANAYKHESNRPTEEIH